MKYFRCVLAILGLFLLGISGYSQILEAPGQRRSPAGTDTDSRLFVHIDQEGYHYQKSILPYDSLLARLRVDVDSLDPDERTIHLTADSTVSFRQIVEMLKIGRKLQSDNFTIADVPVKIILDEPMEGDEKPGPLFLGIAMSKSGALTLNGKPRTEVTLSSSLKSIFESRKRRKVYMYGSRDVDKTVFIKLTSTARYDELTKVLKLVHAVGAFPVAIEIDDVKE